MRIVVLGGLGLQGRAAVIDLLRSPQVSEVVCADAHTRGAESLAALEGSAKLTCRTLDAGAPRAMADLLGRGADAAVDLLPIRFMRAAFEAAVDTGVPLVSTNYAHPLVDLDAPARRRGVVLMPECGLDPGIDLVIMGEAVRRFDTLTRLDSYCGGIPERSACDNPLGYKISWNFEMVLTSQMRSSRFVRDGNILEVPAAEQHETDMNHEIEFPGLGRLEAIPNGDAVAYVERLGLGGTIRDAGRYSLRWPGWRAFWRVAKGLGLLEEAPVPGLPGAITPKQFLVRHLEPRLQYGPAERDLTPMVNVFEGRIQGRPGRLTTHLLIARDLDSGLLGMNIGVGFTASVVAQMIAGGQIVDPGLRSPVRDIPYRPFVDALGARGIHIAEELVWLDG